MSPRTAYYKRYRQANSDAIKEKQRSRTKWARRSIVAWDGEGCNFGENQLYVLLANSKGDSIVNRAGLTTMECFDFLVGNSDPHDINVIFGGSYDANMMIADLPRKNLEELWSEGHTHCFGYFIRYQWRKSMSVKRDHDGKSMTLWDVLGFFQTSFVDTLKLWVPEFDTSEMEAMKAHRPDFDLREMDKIIDYNAEECKLLVEVTTRLFDAFDNAGIHLARYDGAGAAAAGMMRKHKVDTYKGKYPLEIQHIAQIAYAGGRIEAVRTGTLDFGPVKRKDINSAYPTAIRLLPCTAHGAWVHRDQCDYIDRTDFVVYRVRWSFEPDRPFYPFFYRDTTHQILFPREGEGWYWAPEVRAALDTWPEGIEIIECYEFVSECDHRPFAFVDEEYERRRAMKERIKNGTSTSADMAEIPIKLSLNSLYGKMAQQLGWNGGDLPRYHDLCWAGWVTSYTRARMFLAGMHCPNSVIAFATDAVIATEDFPVDVGGGLGQWTEEEFDGIVMVQAGVYFLREVGKDWAEDESKQAKEAKIRGFDRGTLNRAGIVATWRDGESTYPATCTRFVGAGSALASPEWYHRWRTWRTEPRALGLLPQGKRQPNPLWSIRQYATQLVLSLPSVNFTPELMSQPHKLAWSDLTAIEISTLSGVDLRIVENELADSY